MNKRTVDEFLGKIAWEGGVEMALDYGLTPDGYDLPDEMAQDWERLLVRYEEFSSYVAEFLDDWDPDGLAEG